MHSAQLLLLHCTQTATAAVMAVPCCWCWQLDVANLDVSASTTQHGLHGPHGGTLCLASPPTRLDTRAAPQPCSVCLCIYLCVPTHPCRTIYNMCTQKPPYDYSEQLYQRYKDAFNNYINDMVSGRGEEGVF